MPESALTQFGRDLIGFMRVALAEGFRPRYQRETTICAGELGRRFVTLVSRGRLNGWLPWLCDGDWCERLGTHYNLPLGDSICVCVRPPFRGVAHLALEWLRGRELLSCCMTSSSSADILRA